MPFSLTLLPTLLKRLFSLLKIKAGNILSKNNTFHYHLRKTSFHVLSETKLYDKKAIFIGMQMLVSLVHANPKLNRGKESHNN